MKQNIKDVRPANAGKHSTNSHYLKQSNQGFTVNASIVKGLISASGCTKHGGLTRSTERLARSGIRKTVKKCGHIHGKWQGNDVKSCLQFMGINVLAVEKVPTNFWVLTTKTTMATLNARHLNPSEAAVETLTTT